LKSLPQRFGPFIIYTSPSDAPIIPEVLQALLPEPDAVFGRGEKLPSPWGGADTDKRRIQIAGRDFFAKRYNCMGWLYRVKNILRPSRALRSWRAAQQLRSRQVPTPEPLFCMEERHYGLLGRSYIVFPFFEDGVDLLNLWPQLDPTERERCLVNLAAVIGHMHSQGVYHGDTNWRNILVRRQGLTWFFSFIDLDSSFCLAKPRKDKAERDLRHFLRDLERHQVSRPLKDLFLSRWEQASSVDVP
jgi:tRNA A-37 threonylcarbamoyl transferase component Bud32